MKRQIAGRSKGSVIVMVTVALLLLLAMMGMVVDIGLAYYYRRAAQAEVAKLRQLRQFG